MAFVVRAPLVHVAGYLWTLSLLRLHTFSFVTHTGGKPVAILECVCHRCKVNMYLYKFRSTPYKEPYIVLVMN